MTQEDPAEGAAGRLDDGLIEDGLTADGEETGDLIHGCQRLGVAGGEIPASRENGGFAGAGLIDAEQGTTREAVASELEATHCVEPAAGTGTEDECGGHQRPPS